MLQKDTGIRLGTTSYGNYVMLSQGLLEQDQLFDWLFDFQAQEIVEIFAMLAYLEMSSAKGREFVDKRLRDSIQGAIKLIRNDDPDTFRRLDVKLGLRISTDYERLGAKLISGAFGD